MNGEGPRAVIVGAGWRVTRFVVPALLGAGVTGDEVVVARRSDAKSPNNLPGVKVVNSLEAIDGTRVVLTLNCVSAESLVDVQRELLRRYPRATHFCDTPIFHESDRLSAVLRLRRRSLFALEDWPLMPNLAFFSARARRDHGTVSLRVEHFGIPLHFVAWYRSLLGRLHPFGRNLERMGDELTAGPRAGMRVVFRTPKRFPVARVSLETRDLLVEDFHEVEPSSHTNREVLYRVVDDKSVRYFVGDTLVDQVAIDGALIQGFAPFTDRRNVHEMDKFAALVRLFRSVLGGSPVSRYSFVDAVRDTLTARRLETATSCLLR